MPAARKAGPMVRQMIWIRNAFCKNKKRLVSFDTCYIALRDSSEDGDIFPSKVVAERGKNGIGGGTYLYERLTVSPESTSVAQNLQDATREHGNCKSQETSRPGTLDKKEDRRQREEG